MNQHEIQHLLTRVATVAPQLLGGDREVQLTRHTLIAEQLTHVPLADALAALDGLIRIGLGTDQLSWPVIIRSALDRFRATVPTQGHTCTEECKLRAVPMPPDFRRRLNEAWGEEKSRQQREKLMAPDRRPLTFRGGSEGG